MYHTAMADGISAAIDELLLTGSVPPVRAVETLVAVGAPAVSPLVQLLEDIDPDDDDWSPLWAATALGELRSADAVPALLRLLALPEGDVLAEAAVEALAKIGVPALPALLPFTRNAREWETRHYGYTAIGLIPSDESLRFLIGALDADAMLWSSIAMALGELGDRRALPALAALVARCDAREAPAVKESIAILEGRQPPYPSPLAEPWDEKFRGIAAEAG